MSGLSEPLPLTAQKVSALAGTFLAFVLSIATAHANMITRTDADKFYSLRVKLVTLGSDVNQSLQQVVGANPVFNCLQPINNEAQYVVAIAGHVGELITLAAVMHDKDDEALVLHELRVMVPVGIKSLTSARQHINDVMGLCSDVSTANVKGQALLGVFSEMNGVLQSLAKQLGKDPN